jgi:polyphosphate kinase
LLDKNMVVGLYRAAQAGVEIDLIVRGICSLRPGIRGVSSRVHVRSIVGRYLEHSRVFDFANGGEGETWIGSADWMPRNLSDRVEVLVPVRDSRIRERIRHEILDALLQDNRKARLLQRDGTYLHTRRVRRGLPLQKHDGFNAQEFFMSLAEGKLAPDAIPSPQTRRTRDRVGKES